MVFVKKNLFNRIVTILAATLICLLILLSFVFILQLVPVSSGQVLTFNLLPTPPNVSGRTSIFQVGKYEYRVDSTRFTMDAAPYIKNNRTYVPVRYLAYALDLTEKGVKWDAKTNAVTLIKRDKTVKMIIKSKTITVNGKDGEMDVSQETIPPGRTMLPARWVAEAFGATVDWNEATQVVTIFT